jgi:hypothetical protein
MPIYQIFNYEFPEGVTPFIIDEWVRTLSLEEQTEFFQAKERQLEYRQAAMETGNLYTDSTLQGYIWKDEDALQKNKTDDAVWMEYFRRFIKENNIKFTTTEQFAP